MSPDRAQSWLSTLMPVLERGGPVVALVLLCIGTATVWYMLGALDRAVTRNHALVDKMVTMQDTHRQEILRYVHCTPTP